MPARGIYRAVAAAQLDTQQLHRLVRLAVELCRQQKIRLISNIQMAVISVKSDIARKFSSPFGVIVWEDVFQRIADLSFRLHLLYNVRDQSQISLDEHIARLHVPL